MIEGREMPGASIKGTVCREYIRMYFPDKKNSPQEVCDLERNERIELVVEEREGELLVRVVRCDCRFREHLPRHSLVASGEREMEGGGIRREMQIGKWRRATFSFDQDIRKHRVTSLFVVEGSEDLLTHLERLRTQACASCQLLYAGGTSLGR